ncbi:hypothetical protein L1887_31616 [Cichorium endivia]|nr:hypothetical protein L1887_31616 [Cichorium endivia]
MTGSSRSIIWILPGDPLTTRSIAYSPTIRSGVGFSGLHYSGAELPHVLVAWAPSKVTWAPTAEFHDTFPAFWSTMMEPN